MYFPQKSSFASSCRALVSTAHPVCLEAVISTDLPPIVGTGAAQANAVNNLGHAVGYSVSQGSAVATLWVNGVAGAIGGSGTFANAINDSDQIVGYRQDALFVAHAHLWPDDIDLGSLPRFDSSIATGINKSGEVVGVAFDSVNPNLQTGFTWTSAGGMQAITGCASAEAINDAGQVAGISTSLNATICGEPDFGQVGAAVAINGAGVTVGYAGPESMTDAWLFPNTNLGPTLATGINDNSWVIGDEVTAVPSVSVRSLVARLQPHVEGISHPWIWSQDSGIHHAAQPGHRERNQSERANCRRSDSVRWFNPRRDADRKLRLTTSA